MKNNNPNNLNFMLKALAQAQKAYHKNEVPIGAVIIDQSGTIIGSGYNTVETQKTQTAHAELRALRQATRAKQNWRLDGCTLYVTLEPCSMCFAAIKLSRIKTIFFGAHSPLFGSHLDNDHFIPLYNNDPLLVQGGLLAEECSTLLKKFFQQKRKDTKP